MLQVKICGITSAADADFCVDYGADMLGFVFYPRSKRYIKTEDAKKICARIGNRALKTGVFVNEPPVSVIDSAVYAGLDYIQLHGNETPEYCLELSEKFRVIKAFSVRSPEDVEEALGYKNVLPLFDTYTEEFGGSGKKFNWNYLLPYREKLGNFILSGGLNPSNVLEAVTQIEPYGIDVSSGVEKSYGVKDPELVRDFILKARKLT